MHLASTTMRRSFVWLLLGSCLLSTNASAATPAKDAIVSQGTTSNANLAQPQAQANQERLTRSREQRIERIRAQRQRALSEARARGLRTDFRTPYGRRVLLQELRGNRPYYYIEHNVVAADTTSTDEIQAGGSLGLNLDGTNQSIGVWDSGTVRDTHQELSGRVINNDAAGLSDHATHVSGTLIAGGVAAAAQGMAPAAVVRSWDFNNDTIEMLAERGTADPVLVSNHSYGFISGWVFNVFDDGRWAWFGDVSQSTEEDGSFGFYGNTARDWDQIAYDAPEYLIVTSAGNDRNDIGPAPGTVHWQFDGSVGSFVLSSEGHPQDGGASGYDTIGGGGGMAKNVLTIGAVADIPGGYSGPGSVVMSSFSGWGPTDDGRIKPDLVANGVALTSPTADSDTDYSVFSGTSMSAPNVAGSVALLNQHSSNQLGQPLLSATMRALLINTADDAGNVGPDFTFGWGLMNAASAADAISDAAAGIPSSEIHELNLTNGNSNTLFFDVTATTSPVRVTIAWTDLPGTPPPDSVDPLNPMLVHDLDIRILDPLGTLHEPWLLAPGAPASPAIRGDNSVDAVEQIVIDAPVTGTYQLDISHKNTLSVPQNYSVVISTPQGSNQPPSVDAGVDMTVILPGNANLAGLTSDDGLPIGQLTSVWSVVSGPGQVTFADANAPATQATFAAPGVYVLRLTADDTDLSASDEVTITVEASGGANQPPLVDAGADFAVTLPAAGNLGGIAVDDGLPAGVLTTTWSVTGGPGSVTFGNADALDTSVSFAAAGLYTLRLTGDDSALTAFDEVVVSVAQAPQNQAPQVSAGNAQTITLPDGALLVGTATDDGLPDDNLTTTWSLQDGPGSVTFADAGALTTTASFSIDGSYTLRLTADDGELSSFDDMLVTVEAATRITDNLVALYAFDQAGGNSVLDISGVVPALDLTISDALNTVRTAEGGLFLSDSTRIENTTDGNKFFTAPQNSNAITIEAWILAAQPQGGPARIVTLSTSPFARNFTLGQDNDRIEVRLRTSTNGDNGTNTRLFSSPGSVIPDELLHVVFTRDAAGSARLYLDGAEIDAANIGGDFSNWDAAYNFGLGNEFSTNSDDDTRDWLGEYRLVAIYDQALSSTQVLTNFSAGDGAMPPTNQPPTVDAGADLSVTLPAAVTLNASIDDDGLPAGVTLNQVWSVSSGPGAVTFGDANAANTTASFATDGIYVLRISADDSEFVTFDELTITVNPAPPNQPPGVDAGPDQSITLPNNAMLSGNVFDDGLPVGNVTTNWSLISGPGGVSFADPSAISTSASFDTAGEYTLRLTADDGDLTGFDELLISVGAPPPNQAPSVDAGPDQSVNLPNGVTLNGMVTDDGLPLGASLTVAWTQLSGPGSTTFANPGAAITSATFSQAGTYTLRLSADDEALTGSDDVEITVAESQRVTAGLITLYTFDQESSSLVQDVSGTPPVLDLTITDIANTERTVQGGLNLTTATRVENIGDSNKVYTQITTSNALSVEAWILPAALQGGPARIVTLSDSPFARNITLGQDSDRFEVRLRTTSNGDNGTNIRLRSAAGSSVPGQLTHVLFTREAGGAARLYLDGAEVDAASIGGDLSNWNPTFNLGLGNEFSTSSTDPTRNWLGEYRLVAFYDRALTASEVVDNFNAGDGAAPPTNNPPSVDAGADNVTTLPAGVTLNGNVSDDGLPLGSSLSLSWSQVSGPGTTTFVDATAAQTSATFSSDGTYTLRLSVTDSEFVSSDDVVITVNPAPPNTAPLVDAGPDLTVTLPQAASLTGSVTDDGLPLGSNLDVGWALISGPGSVVFDAPNAAVTNATFDTDGTYILRLTADDSEFITSDDVIITVQPAPPNTAPLVDAGPDATLMLPGQLTLSGIISDDGLPAGGSLSSLWTQVSGPGTTTFTNPASASTDASFSTDGEYTLRLTATDGSLTSSDDVVITVSASARITTDLLALYTFDVGSGADIVDVSSVDLAVDLSVENPANAVRTTDNGLTVDPATRISATAGPGKIFTDLLASNAITIEAWVSAAALQGGPARIVTLSQDPFNRNFTLGQDNNRIEVRLRTSSNGNNGTNVRLRSAPGSVAVGNLVHVVFTRDGAGNAHLYVDGIEVDNGTIGGDFSNWDPSYNFALGNEFSTSSTDATRAWRGEYRLVALYNRALDATEVAQNFGVGPQ